MDQSHDDLGDWAASQFGTWSEDQFSGLPFSQPQGAGDAYHDPTTYASSSVGLPQHLSNGVDQTQHYPDFSLYGSQDASAWATSVGDSYPQANNAANGHLNYIDLPQNGQFHGDIRNSEIRDSAHHGFSQSVSHGGPAAQVGFHPDAIHQPQQWQQVVQQIPHGYGTQTTYGNPLPGSHTANIPAKPASPASFMTGHAQPNGAVQAFQPVIQNGAPRPSQPVAKAITQAPQQQATQPPFQQPFQAPVQISQSRMPSSSQPPMQRTVQPVLQPGLQQNVQQQTQQPLQQPPQQASQQPSAPSLSQARFVAAIGAQPLQRQASGSHQQPPVPRTVNPSLAPQPTAQPVAQSQEKPSVTVPAAVSAPAPAPAPVAPSHQPEAFPTQAQIPASQAAATPVSQAQTVPTAPSSKPVKTAAREPETSVVDGVTSYLQVDKEVQGMVKDKAENCWVGVRNLVIDSEPETVRVPERMPRQTMYLKEVKGPLFSGKGRESLWTAAEILGWHQNEYLKYPRDSQHDVHRLKADAIMESMMERAGKAIPKTWWTDSIASEAKKRKLADWMPGTAPVKRLELPTDEFLRLEIEVTAAIASPIIPLKMMFFLHPDYVKKQSDEFDTILSDEIDQLKPHLTDLSKLHAERKKKGASDALDQKITKAQSVTNPLLKKLTHVIDCFLEEDHDALLKFLGMKKSSLMVSLFNTIIRLINVKEGNSPLMKSLLRLLAQFTTVKPSELDQWKFYSPDAKVCAKGMVEALGDDEMNKLVAQIVANAEKNREDDKGPADKSSSETKGRSSSLQKKLAKPNVSATAGAKRAREDDGEVRKVKKVATESNNASAPGSATGVNKTVSTNGKASAPSASKTTTTKTAVTGEASTQAKPRSGLLLPGKTRPPVKPAQKPAATKPNADKLAKPEPANPQPQQSESKPSTSQSQPSETSNTSGSAGQATKPKPAAPAASGFRALMAEMNEPKKITTANKAPTPPADPNETEEQREKRLRKEARRRLGLRVSFKSDDRLVEVREFTREEGEVYDGATHKDVRSNSKDKMEGMALKKGLVGQNSPWEDLVATDFTHIPETKRQETYASRGGNLAIATDEQKIMEERERRELMVVYSDFNDIPPTPKSPPATEDTAMVDAGPITVEKYLPEVAKFEEFRSRHRDRLLSGFPTVIRNAEFRYYVKRHPDYDRYGNPATASATRALRWQAGSFVDPAYGAARAAESLRWLKSLGAKHFKDPNSYDPAHPKTKRRDDYADEEVQKSANFFEAVLQAHIRRAEKERRLLDEASQWAAQLQLQDTVMTDAPAVPVAAYQHLDAPTANMSRTTSQQGQVPGQNQDYTAAWAAYYAQIAQAQQTQQAQQGFAQQPNTFGQPYTNMSPQQLSAIFATLGSSAAQQPQPQQPVAVAVDAAQVQALMAALGNNTAQQQQPGQQSNEYLASLMQWATSGAQNPSVPSPASGVNAQPPGPPPGPPPFGNYGNDRQDYDPPEQRDRPRDRTNSQNHNNRDRDRDGGNNNRQRNKRGRGGGSAGGHRNNSGDNNGPDYHGGSGVNPEKFRTTPCTFYAKGMCTKGSRCTFRHD